MENSCAIILAAGDGKRMKTNYPKTLSRVLFTPILDWVLEAVHAAGVEDICIVTGSKHEAVEQFLEEYGEPVETVYQEQRLGTAHAVKQAAALIEKHAGGNVLVLRGDRPFMDADTIHNALEAHLEENNSATVISAQVEEPEGHSRITRDISDRLLDIVEERNADASVREIQEVNTGAYWFRCDDLLPYLDEISDTPAELHEYCLHDTVKSMVADDLYVNAYISDNPLTALAFSNSLQLNRINDIARRTILERLMLDGIEMPCTDGIIIGPKVQIGRGTLILPGTILRGSVKIGEDCVIGPNSLIENSVVGNGVTLNSVQCFQSEIEDGVSVGPFVHLRPHSHLCAGVKIGDFVEVKNSTIGRDTKVAHLTYVGDSDVGERVNFGCGCVTVNYDGINKHRCTIGNDVFLGCNTNLVAPVALGDYAYTAAGSTITDNVPEDSLAIARARQVNKENWVSANGKKKNGK